MNYQTIEVCIDQGVARLWLNRPAVRNAMNEDVISELTAALAALGSDDNVRVVVLGGRGPAFCAGADLGWMRRMADFSEPQNQASAMELATMLQRLHALPKPTIARVHGPAYAGGMGLASACDIIVAETTAEFCLSEVRIGLVPATISPYVVQALGAHAARRYMLTAERVSAAEAHRIGFVHELCDPGTIDTTIASLTRSLVAAGPAALAATKQLLDDVVDRTIDPALLAMTASVIAQVRASAEGREGVGSFLEKRKPAWSRA
ncbi:enoyl-CoA hydratase/isomerase family protein [uncultured Azohydromonas sp.]|jgi:Enoyl-CoA hydratase/carnithine racemase|uniref:enoyl-CoA hydratase/isomerase family protein n=1 Tax=uncultured Azohydromonas sp. TaxID=487342 RepID=UPI002636D3EB|nr:enoyl-CoA hydratase/isomerase family protein [uncultured Azohydromonas sp.]